MTRWNLEGRAARAHSLQIWSWDHSDSGSYHAEARRGAGTIDYGEFVAGTMSLANLNKRENLLSAFEKFDKDNNGFLTIDELEEALTVRAEDRPA